MRHLLSIVFLLLCFTIRSQVVITKATSGINISADKASNAASPAFTALGNIVIRENLRTDIPNPSAGGTFTISAPQGWKFKSATGTITANGPPNDIISKSITVTANTIIINYTTNTANNIDILTISGIQIQCSNGADVPGTGELLFTSVSPSISGIINNVTSAGSLSQIAGDPGKLAIILPGQVYIDGSTVSGTGVSGNPVPQISCVAFNIGKILAKDQFGNISTSYSGSKRMTYEGPSSGSLPPVYTTQINFLSGQSTTIPATVLKKAETIRINTTDGSIMPEPSSLLTVIPNIVSRFEIKASDGTEIQNQTAGQPFTIMIMAFDADGNICNSGPNAFNGIINLSSTGTLSQGTGMTANFTNGILTSHSVTISDTGTFLLKADSGAISTAGNLFEVGCKTHQYQQ